MHHKQTGEKGSSKKKQWNLLIVAPAWVGDMVMAQTLFIWLKQQNSSVEIDVLAPASTYALLRRMPEVSHAFKAPFSRGCLQLYQRYRLGKQLRKKHYDQAILMVNSWKSALVPWFARIPIRTSWLGEWRYGLVNDIRSYAAQDFHCKLIGSYC